jgi:hypothetical protein
MARTMIDLEEELGRIWSLVGELSGMLFIPVIGTTMVDSDRTTRKQPGSRGPAQV